MSATCSPAAVVYGKHSAVSAIHCASGNTLPFTGIDLAFVIAAAVVLVLMGLSLRRITRTRA